jgi:hypothetical protein
MVPPANYFDHSLDLLGYYEFLVAIMRNQEKAGVTKVINLSTIGGHL